MDEEMVWIPREAIGWHRMWSEIAKRYGDTACRCPETGEAWEYMGTTLRDGAPVQHCFRHRSLNGQPCSVGVDAMPDDLLPAAPTGDAAAPLTPTRLDELDEMARAAQERAARATAGPWSAERGCVLPPADADRGPAKALLEPEILIAAGTAGECVANSAFAAAAREDVPALADAALALTAEVRRLREENARMRPVALAARDVCLAHDWGMSAPAGYGRRLVGAISASGLAHESTEEGETASVFRPAPETHEVDLGCARPVHAGPEASCRLCHPAAPSPSPEPPAAIDERWLPGAVWEHRAKPLDNSTRIIVGRVEGELVAFAAPWFPIQRRATMTPENGWRYVGLPQKEQP